MKFENVCLESVGYCLPEERVTSEELERRLEPLYTRLRLPEGRLELMTGIRERRFWPPGMLPSEKSIESGQQAICAAEFDRKRIGALIHGSVCRDYLEPATASGVHRGLGLPPECLVYDVSNACLGILNGMVQIACLIELGEIEAGLVVGTENSRALVETTIEELNRDRSLTRRQVKRSVASLTIGSGSAAVLLCHRRYSRTANRFVAAVARANTVHHELCHSGADEAAGPGMRPLMQTDSELLMQEGVATGAETFERFLAETGWSRESLHKTCCHQVGTAHRRLMLESFGLQPEIDFPTVETLGNMGSVALPITLALALEQGHVRSGDNVGLFGIGSGINCLIAGVAWQSRGEGTLD